MPRLQFLSIAIFLLVLAACQAPAPDVPAGAPESPAPAEARTLESRVYQVQERFRIANHGPGAPSKHNLWAALIGDISPYQQVLERTISPQPAQVFTDESGNTIAEFDLTGLPPGEQVQIEIAYQVKVNRLAYDLGACEGEMPGYFTGPELHIESGNPQIIALSEELSQGASTPCEQVRAFYDHIGNHLVYSYNGKNWGAQAALGEMGADCTEYAALMIALSRAAGIPARYLEGVLYLSETSEELARTEHAWLEVYLPGVGWTAMDPTLGRSSIYRNDYFAAYSPDHIIVTQGNPPSLRGASYFSHLYWPGKSAAIQIEDFGWTITLDE